MASNFETGNAKNIANLNLLNTNIIAIGALYKPTNPKLALANLESIYTSGLQKQKAVNDLQAPYALAVDERESIFKPLNKELTKLRKAYKATEGVTTAQIEDFMTIARKLKGIRKNPEKVSQNPEDLQTTHSISQLSYDQRTNNMDALISLLENTPNYDPNEHDYKVITYKAKKAEMLLATQTVANKFITLNNARSTRDKTLYTNEDNLIDLANKAKDYIGTILDTNSPQYKAIARIKFRKK